MKPQIRQRADRFARSLTPLLLTLALALVAALPFRVPYFPPVAPFLVLISVYYWSLYRPELLPAPAVLLVGVVHDVLGGGPMGLAALTLLLVHGVARSQRGVLLGKSFAVEWWGFMLIAVATAAVMWLLAALYHVSLIDPLPVAVQAFLTIALYPVLSWLFARSARVLVQEAQA